MGDIVTKEDERPVGKGSGVCLYCEEAIGKPHTWGCVVPQKTVLLKMITEYEVEVPRSWTKEDIEFHRNEGSWCASNALEELKAIEDADGCICPLTTFEYIKDVVKGEIE